MRSTFVRSGLLVALGCLSVGISGAWGQTYPETRPGGSGFRGYFPEGNFGGYAPGMGGRVYQPNLVPPESIPAPPAGTVSPGVVVAPTQPGYIVVPRRRLINGIRYPVPGPNPYADGRPRPYMEYGTGRMVTLAKPWLPGAPGY